MKNGTELQKADTLGGPEVLTSNELELETLWPGNVADDVTSGADTFDDWLLVESADDPECTGRMADDDHSIQSSCVNFFNNNIRTHYRLYLRLAH